MRTTLFIEDDVLAAARGLAERESKPLGVILSALAQQGLQQRADPVDWRNGIQLLPVQAGGEAATLALVNELQDEVLTK